MINVAVSENQLMLNLKNNKTSSPRNTRLNSFLKVLRISLSLLLRLTTSCYFCVKFLSLMLCLIVLFQTNFMTLPIPVAARCKAWVCCRSPAGIAVRILPRDIAVCLL